ncbi:hypothetical protein G4V62_14260 [Bacillaceae bacterium SIJ1]|uniref:zf-HC2 domain-containing protein n=1 Tax=Litoribacterium kuwaitense TaxID=1398745 RepID=UPI0013EE11C2|nr:zf-HC2 domain-containing protein [Litoribacterium kuwaitense]NGP46057.1 hypothetical protein [Litoribacterium kuwaitense]
MKHLTRQQLEDYLAQKLPEVEEERVEEHLYACDDCLARYMDKVQEHHEGESHEKTLAWLTSSPSQ